MVRRNASALTWATIRSSPVLWSVATQVISPSASNFGASDSPSSTSAFEPGAANSVEGSDTARPCLGRAYARGSSALHAAHKRQEARLLGGIIAEAAGELGRDG